MNPYRQLTRNFAGLCMLAALAMACSCGSGDSVAGGGGTDYPNTNTIGGVVASSARAPLAGVRVTLIQPRFGFDSVSHVALDTVVSDARGVFVFDSVDSGAFDIEAVSADSGLISYTRGVAKSAGQALVLDTSVLLPGGGLTGRVVARSDLMVVVVVNGTWYRATVDSAGVYRFPLLPAGTVDLSILVFDTAAGIAARGAVLRDSIEADSVRQAPGRALSDVFAWPHAARVMVNTTRTGTDLNAPLHRFPLALRLDSATMDFAQVRSDGSNVRFATTDGRELAFEIEQWDSAGSRAAVWVLLDTLLPDSVQSFYMYWGADSAAARSDGREVFDTSDGGRAVLHLADSSPGRGATDVFKDATAGDAHGDDQVTADGKDGVVGLGQELAGSGDYIVARPALLVPEGSLTVSAWIRPRSIPGPTEDRGYRIAGTYDDDFVNSRFYGFSLSTYQAHLVFNVNNGGAVDQAGTWNAIPDAQWMHVAAVYAPDSGRVWFYVNGGPAPDDDRFTSAAMGYGVSSMTLLGHPDRHGFDGWLDEVRICGRALTPDEIRVGYDTQKPGQVAVTVRR